MLKGRDSITDNTSSDSVDGSCCVMIVAAHASAQLIGMLTLQESAGVVSLSGYLVLRGSPIACSTILYTSGKVMCGK